MRRVFWASIGVMGAIASLVAPACSNYGSAEPPPPATADASGPLADAGSDAPTLSPQDSGAGSADATAAASAYGAAVLADGPTGYWRMTLINGVVPNVIAQAPALVPDDPSKLSAITGALAGESNEGLLLNGALLKTMAGSSYDFNGPAKFSMECWVKVLKPVDEAVVVLGKVTVSNFVISPAVDGYVFSLDKTSRLQGIFGSTGGSVFTKGDEDSVDQAWHHYVLVVDTSVTLFVDGIAVAANVASQRPKSKPNVPFTVGGVVGSIVPRFAGAVDEVAIYEKALTEQQVNAHFSAAH